MIYIQLSEAIKSYNRVRIKEIHFYETDNRETQTPSVVFKYQICKKLGENYYEALYEKTISITNQTLIDQIADFKPTGSTLSVYESISKLFLEYLILNSYETGTLEIG